MEQLKGTDPGALVMLSVGDQCKPLLSIRTDVDALSPEDDMVFLRDFKL